MALEHLRASLSGSPVVKFGDYDYFVHPITDGIPLGDPAVLDEVTDAFVHIGDWSRCDKIVTAESMGFPLAAVLSLKTQKPYVFIRRGDRVVFVDDVLSTGGTVTAVVMALRAMGAEIVDALIVFEKTRDKGRIERELGLRIKTLLAVEVRAGRLVERS